MHIIRYQSSSVNVFEMTKHKKNSCYTKQERKKQLSTKQVSSEKKNWNMADLQMVQLKQTIKRRKKWLRKQANAMKNAVATEKSNKNMYALWNRVNKQIFNFYLKKITK